MRVTSMLERLQDKSASDRLHLQQSLVEYGEAVLNQTLSWKVTYATFVWGEKLYDDIQLLTFSLTNFHASLLPLRLEDHGSYRAVMARYKRMAAENTTKRAAAQRRYVQRQAERLAATAARADRVVFTTPSVNRHR
ncbi:hypothetical protein AaE_000353 [Aphanomyces astaci]|uniref:Uncharacterized protein n=1 Tax=Aphanomyces astaci TaxID=112090 RepID=A0A6A5AW21_APHAT|nr:hypothetical protein AaE_000353 [Aphanomyces astaci]